MILNPYIKRKRNSVPVIMRDVIYALLPAIIVACVAYGWIAVCLFSTAVLAAVATELIFSSWLLENKSSFWDGSAVVTGLLLTCTLSPATPWYVVAFGSFSAILFGKILWGGLGKNRFNPALLGREFMAVFFASTMTSHSIWDISSLVVTPSTSLFSWLESSYLNIYLSDLIYKTSGALGEYSVVALLLGGGYLLFRRRISWHIPFALMLVFSLFFWMVDDGSSYKFSLSGILLGTIFMATDMPSSPTTANGKLFYGGVLGLIAALLIVAGVRYEYLSYSILLMNDFSYFISDIFRPRVWGTVSDRKTFVESVFYLLLAILGTTLAVVALYYYHLISYLFYIYIVFIIIKFNFSFRKNIHQSI